MLEIEYIPDKGCTTELHPHPERTFLNREVVYVNTANNSV
jgi:hypothetical protein